MLIQCNYLSIRLTYTYVYNTIQTDTKHILILHIILYFQSTIDFHEHCASAVHKYSNLETYIGNTSAQTPSYPTHAQWYCVLRWTRGVVALSLLVVVFWTLRAAIGRFRVVTSAHARSCSGPTARGALLPRRPVRPCTVNYIRTRQYI
jgi:hypothetical protein